MTWTPCDTQIAIALLLGMFGGAVISLSIAYYKSLKDDKKN